MNCRCSVLRLGAAFAKALVLAAVLLVASVGMASAEMPGGPPVFNSCQNDVGGANDPSGDGQKDLTKFCIEPGTENFELWTKWNWDETTLTGSGQSGDACSLYDTDDDGNVNRAVCVSWDDGTRLRAVRVFACAKDTRPDNCDDATLLNHCSSDASAPCMQDSDCTVGATCQLYSPSTGLAVGTPGTRCTLTLASDDPFADDDSYPNDAQAICGVDLGDFEASEAKLVDACSYPSASTPSSASDCILAKQCTLDSQCNDGNTCTTDYCDTGLGLCRHTADTGEACEDGQFCTVNDACTSQGFCEGGGPKDCSASGDQCHDGTCDETSDSCTAGSAKPDGTTCGSGPAGECDLQDTCQAGLCVNNVKGSGVACGSSANDDCTNPDTCNGAGLCVPNNAADGINCGDAGTECTNQDTCLAGACHDNGYQGAGVACGSDSDTQCDNPDTCNGSGVCSINNAADGINCGDAGTECTNQDVCQAGVCQDSGYKPADTSCGLGWQHRVRQPRHLQRLWLLPEQQRGQRLQLR